MKGYTNTPIDKISNFPDIDYEAISIAYNLAIDLPLYAPLTQEQIASLPLTDEEKELCSNIHWRNLANLLHMEERYRHISISIMHKSQKYSDEKVKAHKEEMDYELRGEISPAKAVELARQKHTKQLFEEQENISREKIRQQYENKNNITEAGLPPMFHNCTIDYISQQGIPEQLEYVHYRVASFINNLDSCIANGNGLIITGPCGTLKSSYGAAILLACFKAGINGRMELVMSLLDELSVLERENKSAYAQRMQVLCQVSVLVLDDLGAEGTRPDYVKSKLEQIVFRRHANNKTTIVTTNKNCQELKYMYSERIMDRLTAKCLVLETKGPSQRRRYLNALSTFKKETTAISKEVA